MQQNNQAYYSNENSMLRQLYLARQQRLKRQSKLNQAQQTQQIKIKQKEQLKIIPFIQQKHQQKNNYNDNLYLNTCIYDTRSFKPNFFIKISTMFQNDPNKLENSISKDIQVVFMSTFGFQMELIAPIAKKGFNFILLNHSDQKGQGKVYPNFQGFKNMTLIQKEKQNNQYGVFHAKTWLIKFKTFLRVVISTGNLHLADFAYWQNAYWYQDFPLKSNIKQNFNSGQNQGQRQKKETKKQFNFNQDFQKTLDLVLKNMIPQKVFPIKNLGINLSDYLFQNVNVVLIPSIPGYYKGNDVQQQGICKVQKILKNFNKIQYVQQDPILTYNTTSLGTIDQDFCQQIYNCFCGGAKQKIKGLKFKKQNYKLVYPTQQYIKNETCGAAEVLFLLSNNYQKSTLGKKILYKYTPNPNNLIKGSIPHLKTVVVQSPSDPNKCVFYVGSHNMTKAAWGKLANKTKNISLTINNSELGILFLDYDKNKIINWLPYKYPPQKYNQKDKPFLRDFI